MVEPNIFSANTAIKISGRRKSFLAGVFRSGGRKLKIHSFRVNFTRFWKKRPFRKSGTERICKVVFFS